MVILPEVPSVISDTSDQGIHENCATAKRAAQRSRQLHFVSDCTLRDTANAPGVFLGPAATAIAQCLDNLGIDEIEHGVASAHRDDEQLACAINELNLSADTSCVFFCLQSSSIAGAVDFATGCGYDAIMISMPSSDLFQQLKLKRSFRATCSLLEKAITYAVRAGLKVTFSGEDAARADLAALLEYVRVGEASGASRFRFAESVACLYPSEMRTRITNLCTSTTIPVEVHCHSAHGLAVANTIAAFEAGARWASVTVNGIGERGGNTPLEPVLLYLWRHFGADYYALNNIWHLSNLVSQATGLHVHRFTPIVGADCFAYEISSQYKEHRLYEEFPAEMVGNRRHLVYGRKADTAALQMMVQMLGHDLSAEDLALLARRADAVVSHQLQYLDLNDLRTLMETLKSDKLQCYT